MYNLMSTDFGTKHTKDNRQQDQAMSVEQERGGQIIDILRVDTSILYWNEEVYRPPFSSKINLR